MIKQTIYVLAVQDLQASVAFYQDKLGFTVQDIGDDGWRMFERDGCRIMAGHCPDAASARDLGDHSYFAYWVVENAERLYTELTQTGVECIKDLRDKPWGMREFGIRTIDGHRIMIGQDIPV